MNVKLRKVEGNVLVDAKISDAKLVKVALPDFNDGWRFNFSKHSKRKNFKTFIIYSEEATEIIEGCLIFEMKDKIEPYMAYIELATHNKGEIKKFDFVAGCLIAFACRLSFKYGKNDYQGYLAFDVLEGNKENEVKLMSMYSTKYNAFKISETTMLIPPMQGKKLIDKFLNNNYES